MHAQLNLYVLQWIGLLDRLMNLHSSIYAHELEKLKYLCVLEGTSRLYLAKVMLHHGTLTQEPRSVLVLDDADELFTRVF